MLETATNCLIEFSTFTLTRLHCCSVTSNSMHKLFLLCNLRYACLNALFVFVIRMTNSSNKKMSRNSRRSSSSSSNHRRSKKTVKRNKTLKTKMPSLSKQAKRANLANHLPITFVDWKAIMPNFQISTMVLMLFYLSSSPCFVCVVLGRTRSRNGDCSTGDWITCFVRTTGCYTPS